MLSLQWLARSLWINKKLLLAAFIDDINTLPMPWFKGFPEPNNNILEIYGDGINTYKPAVTLHSTRGCPYKCDFCLWIQVMYDNKKLYYYIRR